MPRLYLHLRGGSTLTITGTLADQVHRRLSIDGFARDHSPHPDYCASQDAVRIYLNADVVEESEYFPGTNL